MNSIVCFNKIKLNVFTRRYYRSVYSIHILSGKISQTPSTSIPCDTHNRRKSIKKQKPQYSVFKYVKTYISKQRLCRFCQPTLPTHVSKHTSSSLINLTNLHLPIILWWTRHPFLFTHSVVVRSWMATICGRAHFKRSKKQTNDRRWVVFPLILWLLLLFLLNYGNHSSRFKVVLVNVSDRNAGTDPRDI